MVLVLVQNDGYDVSSVAGIDPGFADAALRNFTLSPTSYAVATLGFEPFDTTIVGPIASVYPH